MYTPVSQMEVTEDYASTIAYLHLSLCKNYSEKGHFLLHTQAAQSFLVIGLPEN